MKLLAFVAGGLLFAARVVAAEAVLVEEMRFERDALRVEATASGAVSVSYPGAVQAPEGAPDLPWVPLWIEVPAGAHVVGVKAEPSGVQKQDPVRVVPVAPTRGAIRRRNRRSPTRGSMAARERIRRRGPSSRARLAPRARAGLRAGGAGTLGCG